MAHLCKSKIVCQTKVNCYWSTRVLFIGGHDPDILHPFEALTNDMRKAVGGNYF